MEVKYLSENILLSQINKLILKLSLNFSLLAIGNLISSMTYNGSDSKVFVTDVSSSEGLAIDWVSRNIFWTDSNKETVEVANLDTQKRKVLVSEGLVNPRGIAAHPYRG